MSADRIKFPHLTPVQWEETKNRKHIVSNDLKNNALQNMRDSILMEQMEWRKFCNDYQNQLDFENFITELLLSCSKLAWQKYGFYKYSSKITIFNYCRKWTKQTLRLHNMPC